MCSPIQHTGKDPCYGIIFKPAAVRFPGAKAHLRRLDLVGFSSCELPAQSSEPGSHPRDGSPKLMTVLAPHSPTTDPPSCSVDVILQGEREIIIDDDFHLGAVQAPRGDVCAEVCLGSPSGRTGRYLPSWRLAFVPAVLSVGFCGHPEYIPASSQCWSCYRTREQFLWSQSYVLCHAA